MNGGWEYQKLHETSEDSEFHICFIYVSYMFIISHLNPDNSPIPSIHPPMTMASTYIPSGPTGCCFLNRPVVHGFCLFLGGECLYFGGFGQ